MKRSKSTSSSPCRAPRRPRCPTARSRSPAAARPPASVSQPIDVSAAPVPYGAERFAAAAEEEGGGPTTQAGAHPFQVTNTIQWNAGRLFDTTTAPPSPRPPQRRHRTARPAAQHPRHLPRRPGRLRDRRPRPARWPSSCTATKTSSTAARPRTRSGVASVTVIESSNFGFLRLAVPIFNLPPAHGEPARFGFMPAGVPVVIDTSVDPDDALRITGEVRNVTQVAKVLSATISLWGVPGDPRHDSARGWECAYYLFEDSACHPAQEPRADPLLSHAGLLRGPAGLRGRAGTAGTRRWAREVATRHRDAPAAGRLQPRPLRPQDLKRPDLQARLQPLGL